MTAYGFRDNGKALAKGTERVRPVGIDATITPTQGVWVYATAWHEEDVVVATHQRHRELSEAKRDALNRMSYIEGHLAGIRRMVEEDKYCVDVLKQTFAVRRAIQKLESRLLEGHLGSCVIDGVKEGREKEVLGELLELYALSDRR